MSRLGEPLSQREQEVLQCIAEGAANKEIASVLSISQNTVKVHLRNIFDKLGVSSRTEAMTVAIQQGLLVITEDAISATAPDEIGIVTAPQDATTVLDPSHLLATQGHLVSQTEVSDEPAVTGSPPQLLSLRPLLALSILLAVAIAVTLYFVRLSNTSVPPTPEPFQETPLGDSNWLLSKAMDRGRARMAVVALGLDVYLIGGQTSDGTTGSVMTYDTVAHTWRESAAKPTAVSDASADVLFGEIFVPGGRLANEEPTDTVEAYSPTNGAWRTITSLPRPIAGGLTLSDGSFLYLLGGWDGTEYLDTAYVYDVAAETWRPLPPLNHGRAYATGKVVTGRLYLVGGHDGQSDLADCQYFDISLTTWFDCPDLLQPRAGAGAAVVLNKLYVIGGTVNGDDEITYSEVYDPNSEIWQVVNTPMLSDGTTWAYLGVTNVEVRIYALGGQRDDDLSAENYVYAPPVYRTFIPSASTGSGD